MIGNQPRMEDLCITTGQDFVEYFGVKTGEQFPDGTTLMLHILSTDMSTLLGFWPAVLVEPGGAQFQIDAEVLDDIPTAARYRIYVQFPEVAPRLCWYRGSVWRKD